MLLGYQPQPWDKVAEQQATNGYTDAAWGILAIGLSIVVVLAAFACVIAFACMMFGWVKPEEEEENKGS